MSTNYIELERPGGSKKALFRWDNEMLIIGCTVVCLFLALGIKAVFHVELSRPSLLSASVIGILALIFPLMTIFIIKNHAKLDRHYKHCFDLIEEEKVHCAPTHLGWITCGESWIGTTINPISAARLEAHEIGNVYWGGRELGQSQLLRDYPVEINMLKISPISDLYWLLILAKDDTSRSVFATFRKKSEIDAWVKIACDLASGQPVSILHPRGTPTKWQLACKAKVIPLTIVLIELIALGLLTWLFATDRLSRGSQFLFPLVMFINGGLMSPSSSRGKSANMTNDVMVDLNGGELPVVNQRVPVVAGKKLILNHTRYPGFEWVEQISIKDITRVNLENWGKNFAEGDLKNLIDKNSLAEFLTVRLYLNRPTDNEREIRLRREDAIAWSKKLSDLVETS